MKRENRILKTTKNYIFILTIVLLSSFISELIGQGSIVITSSSSIPFSVKVNTQLETSSPLSDGEFYFPHQSKGYFQILDSTEQLLLELDLVIKQNKAQKFNLKFISEEWRFLPESVFDLPLKYLDSLHIPENNSKNPSEALFIITSRYKSTGNLNQKEIKEIESLVFERDRIIAVKKLISQEVLSKKETIKALGIISYEDKRLEIIEEYSLILKTRLIPEDVELLFKLDRYKTKALEHLGR
ncbi:MAG: hypothetical protein QNL21_08795 [Flavobacteriales bacterium]